MPTVKRGDKAVHIESWGGFVEQQIREAQARGDFDNLPGTGKPLDLEPDNPFNPEWSSAFRVAKNAGAAPLWVELDKEVGERKAALEAMLDRTARYLADQERRLRAHDGAQPAAPATSPAASTAAAGGPPASVPAPRASRRWRLWRRRDAPPAEPTSAVVATPLSLADLEAERRRARARYLKQAAELDQLILEFNTHRPRALSWVEKPRLLPELAARSFDERCPPVPLE